MEIVLRNFLIHILKKKGPVRQIHCYTMCLYYCKILKENIQKYFKLDKSIITVAKLNNFS